MGKSDNQGFTVVELLVALALAGILGGAVYSTFNSQHKSYVVQERVAAMQQNLRAAMFMMERDIRMAACDPTGGADAEIITANADSIQFTLDITDDSGDGDPDGDVDDANENVIFALDDNDDDGDNDLERNGSMIAENIEVLNFVYLDEDENKLDDDGGGNVTTSIDDIRTVMIALVARTARVDRDFVNGTAYRNLLGEQILAAQNDNFRRRLLTSRVQGRNLGLN
jgi:type IV pilus assembly protein PilW